MKRFFILLAIVVCAGFFTRAFAATPEQGPHALVSRAGAVVLLVQSDASAVKRAEWFAHHMPPIALFADTDQSQWYAPYLEVAFEQGLIKGNADATFRPGDALTQEEAAALAVRYKEQKDPSAGVILNLPSDTTTTTNWLVASVSNATWYGVKLPLPVRFGAAMERGQWDDMMQSLGIHNPDQLRAIAFPSMPLTSAAKPQLRPLVLPARSGTVAQSPMPLPTVSTKIFSISMPSLGIKDLTVTHPSDPFSSKGLLAVLKDGVGHLFSYPGQGGKIFIYGHSSGYPWDVSQYTKIFRQINKLSVGDKVTISYAGRQFTYQVTSKQTVPAKDMSAYGQEGREELVLYTCWPPDSISQRYLVHAVPVETVVAR